MKVLTVFEVAANPSHSLWWLVNRPDFARDLLQEMVPAYQDWDKIPREIRSAGGGIRLYNQLLEGLYAYLQKYFGAGLKREIGQPRFVIALPNETTLEVAIRTGHPDENGFSCGECGPAVEQLSLIEFMCFETEEGNPMKKGVLLIHRECPKQPGHLEGWLAKSWSAKDGDTYIKCPECIELGSAQFRFEKRIKRDDTGDEPDL